MSRTPNGTFDAELIPEIDNPYDPDAISVRYQGEGIAYIPRGLTHLYWQPVAKVFASGAIPVVKAKKYRGPDRADEVKLYLPSGEEALPPEYQNLTNIDGSQIAGHFRKRTPVFQRHPQHKLNRAQSESNLGAIACGLILLVLLIIVIF